LLVREGPIDDHVFDPDVRRSNRNLAKAMFGFDVHGVDDHGATCFENP
jgi:hypothetical protein